MSSEPNIRAKRALFKLKKAGESDYFGLTSNTSALQPASNIVDTYRAVESADIKDIKDQIFLNNLELARRLMSIDNKFYHVRDDAAHELLDYLEQMDYDVMSELDMEYKIKKLNIKKKMKDIVELNMDDYITDDDYKRAVAYKLRQLNMFEGRLEYLKTIINTIKEYIEELKDAGYMQGNSLFQDAKPDFSYNFTNNNPDPTAAGKLK